MIMKKIFTLTAAALMSVALAPAAISGEKERNIAAFKAAGFTLVNEDCADSTLIEELWCYSSAKPILMQPGNIYFAGATYKEILKANPGVQNYLVAGHLPPNHWIATRQPAQEMSSLE
jgi:hypothetical protein